MERIRRAYRAIGWVPLLAALLALVALVPFPAPSQLTVARSPIDGAVVVRGEGYRGSITLVSERRSETFGDIVYYHDARYPRGRGASERFVHGLVNHLNDALIRRGYTGRARDVDATGLRTLLARSPRGACLLMLDGVSPTTVRSQSLDLLRAWLRAGGTVIWAGEPFDAVYGGPVATSAPPTVDFTKWAELYGHSGALEPNANWQSPDLGYGFEEAPGWGLTRIPFVRTTFGAIPERVPGGGGFSIGYHDGLGHSSLSVFAVGRGHVVLFADGLEDEAIAADYVAQILYTQAWQGAGAVEYHELRVGDQALTIALGAHASAARAYSWTAHYGPFASIDFGARTLSWSPR